MIVDAGNLVNDARKAVLIAQVMSELRYDAVGLSSADLAFGQDLLKALTDARLPLLLAGPGADPSTVPFVVSEVDGVKIGVVSFGGATLNSGSGNELALRRSLYSAYLGARRASDILILVDQSCIATPDWLDRNRSRLGSPDIVMGGPLRTSLSQPQVHGSTFIVPSSFQSRSVGVIDVEYTPGSGSKFTAQLVRLDEKIADNAGVAQRVTALMEKISGSHAAVAPQHTGSAADKPYYSSLVCRSCHADQHADWKASGHAKALDTLVAANRTAPECLSCHSEAYRRTQNVQIALRTNAGVECASCHIDSLPHGAERVYSGAKAKVDPKACLECHTKERSAGYDAKTYFPKISHIRPADAATAAH